MSASEGGYSATSVAANCPTACRVRSKSDFVAKPSMVVEEADEKMLQLELVGEGAIMMGSLAKKMRTHDLDGIITLVRRRRTQDEWP